MSTDTTTTTTVTEFAAPTTKHPRVHTVDDLIKALPKHTYQGSANSMGRSEMEALPLLMLGCDGGDCVYARIVGFTRRQSERFVGVTRQSDRRWWHPLPKCFRGLQLNDLAGVSTKLVDLYKKLQNYDFEFWAMREEGGRYTRDLATGCDVAVEYGDQRMVKLDA